ncbi:MAG: nucleoside kinase [Candidatus Azobacteroides sp.]|nr:nucleoside kinase [Candidatus Azobacteroides sp.]
MKKEIITIYCKNNQKYYEFEAGISVLEIYNQIDFKTPYLLTCCRVNNKNEDLNFRCYRSKDIEYLDITNPSALRTYVRTLCFVLSKAVSDCFPNSHLYIEHPLSKGYYCYVEIGRSLTEQDVETLKKRMWEIVDANYPFEVYKEQTPKVVEMFRDAGKEDKARLFETSGQLYSTYQKLDGYLDFYNGSLLPSSNYIYMFELTKYNDGVLLRIPSRENPRELQSLIKQDKMMNVYKEEIEFLRVWGLMNVGDLNKAEERGEIGILIKVAEALQEKQIARIAATIAQKYNDGVRVVLISGPSSSGKTTFCKRLEVQLMTNKIRPISISLDDYYVNRADTPLTPEGEYDFESLYAIDLKTFNEDLNKLLGGEEVALPSYNFTTGTRVYRGNSIKMEENTILMMEGIHALNPDLIPQIDSHTTYKIYVSALTSISLDDHNWIPTTDNRLIRRIIRDYQFRTYTAKETIARWESVREGEEKWIFPYQENADEMFNSAMLYELAALRRFAEPILSQVMPSDPEYSEAYRLLKFLRFFKYIDVNELSSTSLLREFLGGSSFRY